MKYVFIPIALIAIFLSHIDTSKAWGGYGHVMICEIAYRQMSDESREVLNRLIEADGEYTSFNQSCLEADRAPRERPKEHYVNYPRDKESVTDESCGASPTCIFTAISNDLGKLSDPALSDSERGRAVIYLGHWIGDLHQPLHVSFGDDRGGNSIKKRGRCGTGHLHGVWDKCIVERRVLNFGLDFWARYTRVYRAVDELFPKECDENCEAEIDAERAHLMGTSLHEWANESFQLVKQPEVGYCVQKDGECWYEEDRRALESDGTPKVIQMNDEYLDRFGPIAQTRIRQAGIRLGGLIEQALVNN